MGTVANFVRATIDTDTKERATHALAAMSLSATDAIRMPMHRIAIEQRLPFEVKVPNAATRKAIAKFKTGKGKKFKSAKALIAELNADN